MAAAQDPRRVFLTGPPGGEGPELAPGEARHLVRVLRVRPGEELLGLDGAGSRWPLTVRSVRRGEVELEVTGPPATSPPPGRPGAPLPWIEVAVAWPRRTRLEETLGPLVQLGAAAITPLDARHRGAEPRPVGTPERWLRIAREACKQSRRDRLPVFHPAQSPLELALARRDADLVRLEPDGPRALHEHLALWREAVADDDRGSRARPLVLCIGPEGGFAGDEREALDAAGAEAARLAPHVLRIETAALAAMAVAACVLARPVLARREG